MREAFIYALFAALTCAASLPAHAGPLLDTPHGPVEGLSLAGDVEAWLGIPFAAPPVGARRWRAPADPQPWTLPRQATAFGPWCVQMGTVTDPATGHATSQAVGDEDCLYLNLWRPAAASAQPRSVMVWIHGGANTAGAASLPAYDGATLASQEDVVVVSLQYRLNTQGFFNHPALHQGDPAGDSGDFGLLDMIKALEWVRDAAPSFGGDPSRVMIFGESAGGYNVWSLMLSPAAEGLFASAAVESGCPQWVGLEDARAQSQRIAELLAVAQGLTSAEEASAFLAAQGEDWLRSWLYDLPASVLLETVAAEGLITFNFGAIADGAVLPADAAGRFSAGAYAGVPTIVGANRDESKALYNFLYPIGPGGYHFWTDLIFGEGVGAVEALYPRRDYLGRDLFYERLVDMTDGWFELVCTVNAALTAAPHHPVYLYRFDYDRLAPPADAAMGAAHTMEIPFVFGTYDDADYAEGAETERAILAGTMMSAWACLAREGDPAACPGTRPWPQLEAAGRFRMVFDGPAEVSPIPADELEKMSFWLGASGATRSFRPR